MTAPLRPAGLTHAISFAIPDRAAALLLGLAIYSLFFCAWDLSHAHGPRETILCELAFVPMGLAVIGLVRHTSRMPGLDAETARAWRLLAWALFLDWTGTVLWLFADAFFHVSPRLLSLIPSAAYYACLLASLVSFPFGPRTPAERRQFWLDVVIVSLGAGMLLWYAFHGAQAAAGPADPHDALVAGVYAAGDAVMLLGIAVIVLGCPGPSARPAFLLVAASLLLALLGDVFYSSMVFRGWLVGAGLADGALMLSWLVSGAGAHAYRRLVDPAAPETGRQAARSLSVWLLPQVAIAVGFGTLVMAVLERRSTAVAGLATGGALLTGVVILRLHLGARENARLLAEQVLRASLREVSERAQAVEDELRAQKDLFAQQLAVARATTQHPELERTLQNTLEIMGTLTGAEGATLFLLDEAGSLTGRLVTRRPLRPDRPTQAVRLLRSWASSSCSRLAPLSVSTKGSARHSTAPGARHVSC